jgi:hypothetical protein
MNTDSSYPGYHVVHWHATEPRVALASPHYRRREACEDAWGRYVNVDSVIDPSRIIVEPCVGGLGCYNRDEDWRTAGD